MSLTNSFSASSSFGMSQPKTTSLAGGPKRLPELEEYFETRHDRTAEYICAENGIEYSQAASENEIEEVLKSFYKPSENTKLLEIFTVPETNEQAFKQLKHHINEQVNF